MEENKEYISEDTLNNGSEFLAHYGVKGMKWRQHKKSVNSLDSTLARRTAKYTVNTVARNARIRGEIDGKVALGTQLHKNKKQRNSRYANAIARAASEKAEQRSYSSVSKGLYKKNKKAHRDWVEARQKSVRKSQRKTVRDSVKTRAKGYSTVNKLVSRSIASTAKR